ncbi:MAG: phosphopantetheine-binding protein [Deltaproteobacteria bacterium]|nr:phosphopantetheine-binding protein [Deltaproteobacteria bacterium]
MTRDEILAQILTIFEKEFEIKDPRLDVNLGEAYDFDSIDALELLGEIEKMLGSELTRQEKRTPWKSGTSIRSVTTWNGWPEAEDSEGAPNGKPRGHYGRIGHKPDRAYPRRDH